MINNAARSLLCEQFIANNTIDPKLYDRYVVKRGLRNSDGTGVMAGLTNICNVHGYVVNEGEKSPIQGQLIYRGYNINDLVSNAQKEDRFGYEEIVYLLLMGDLPNREELTAFKGMMAENRSLPNNFFEDMILKAPSKNIMNKMARAILALYSYDDNPENRSPEYEMATAISIISKLPNIMVSAYQVKKRCYDGESLFMHPLIPTHSTAEMILSALRPDRQFTEEEAKILDLLLMLHAEHGGGNNSTFACRVLTSSGTDPYSAYSAAIGSLKGPRHGGANLKVAAMHQCIKDNVQNWEDEGEIADFLTKILTRKLLTTQVLSMAWVTLFTHCLTLELSYSERMPRKWLRTLSLRENTSFLKRWKDLLLSCSRRSRAVTRRCALTLICTPALFTVCWVFLRIFIRLCSLFQEWQAGAHTDLKSL